MIEKEFSVTLDTITRFVPLIAGLLYAVVGVAYILKKEWSWATVWCSYSVANFGLMVAGNQQ